METDKQFWFFLCIYYTNLDFNAPLYIPIFGVCAYLYGYIEGKIKMKQFIVECIEAAVKEHMKS